jgi:uncharacterized membrane protein HdeD (DUF308 family)
VTHPAGIHPWSLVLRGLAGILVGVVSFLLPGVTIAALVLVFGAYAFADGGFNLFAAWRQHSWVHVLQGLFGVTVGVLTFLWPAVTTLVLVCFIAAWAILVGAFEIAAAIRLRKHLHREWFLVLAGVCSVLFGILLYAAPIAGAMVLAWWFGAYALAFGAILLILAFRLRHFTHGGTGPVPHRA